MTQTRPLLMLLDRDGTLIKDKHYLADPDGVELLPHVPEALRLLQEAGCALLVLTNQSGVGRGYFDEGAVAAVNARFCELLLAEDVRLHGIWHCPHAPEEACACRKPKPGLAHKAAQELGILQELLAGQCVSVGDKMSDVQLGQKLHGKGVLVRTGKGEQEYEKISRAVSDIESLPDFVAADMLDAARWIVHTKHLWYAKP